MPENCPFCTIKPNNKIIDGKLAFVIADMFPVTELHSLIIPKRHFTSFFDVTTDELLEINELLKTRKEQIKAHDETVVGFNIGINIGEAAGQSVAHLHVHLIPRRAGDLKTPKGGVRGVIPSKQNY